MHKIIKLPLEIQKRICAGEVIVSPYNVVKELVENSIDAGSSNILIVVSKDNLNIEVHDDGCGIHESDFTNLAVSHCTSKFALCNLRLIDSFGFRGEALASIRCVSNLIIKSKIKDAEVGFIKNYKDESVKPVSMNNGTSIFINNLFYNNKIREKCFYKKLAIYKSINELISSFAIKNPRIKFQFNDITYLYYDEININDNINDKGNFNGNIKDNLKDNINDNINNQYNDNIKNNINENIKDNINDNINDKGNFNGNINDNIKDNIKDNINENIKDNINDNIKDNIKDNINENIKDNIKDTIKDTINDNINDNIKDNIKDKINLINDFVDFADFLKTFKNQIPDIKNEDTPSRKFRARQISSIFNISPIRQFTSEFLTMIFTPTMVNFKNFQFILFINNRLVSNANIKSSIGRKYSSILPKGRHPFVYLDLNIPAKHVDVNVHPSKKEVLIEYEDLILEIIDLVLDEGLNENKEVYKQTTPLNTKNTESIYKEYSTLEVCLLNVKHKEYRLISINKLRSEIVEIDKSFIKDIVYIGISDLPEASLLVQYNQYLMKCNFTDLRPILIYQYFVYNFGNFPSTGCNIRNKCISHYKDMLKEYFQIEIENDFIKRIPLLGNFSGNPEDWANFKIENSNEEDVFREILLKLSFIYRDVQMDRNLFSIMKRDMKCTKEVLKIF